MAQYGKMSKSDSKNEMKFEVRMSSFVELGDVHSSTQRPNSPSLGTYGQPLDIRRQRDNSFTQTGAYTA
ncbi:hypothetical protein ACN38_g1542 [Penicillium nordicum]|uniref:Uncharacterized protein n=1 Tax=Penicillium nordicum TaxID=229535 RepID=A0A0M8P8M5_9EURO|nr:hypothetical protein ACN38_g1542 [Penicillium nordicum]